MADRSEKQHGQTTPAEKGEDAAQSERNRLKKRQERLLDEGLEETFPASDPVAVSIVKDDYSRPS